jgi:hypothetical protein
MNWPLIITAVKDVVLGLAAAVTACVAIAGLKRWRQELRGKADFEAARALARATYNLRDQIALCRSPFIRAHEFPATYQGDGKHSSEEEAEAWAHVYKARWEPVWKALQEFDTQSLEAEALWGESIRARTDALRACAKELSIGIEARIEDKASGGQNFASDKDFAKSIRATVSASGSDTTNKLSQKVVSAVAGIEEQLRPHLARS